MNHCHTCGCNVPRGNWSEHVWGKKHISCKDYRSTHSSTFCEVCQCLVPRNGMDAHVEGSRHTAKCCPERPDRYNNAYVHTPCYVQNDNGRSNFTNGGDSTNDDTDDDDSSHNGSNCDIVECVGVSEIRFSQTSISSAFKDGTSLDEGIQNVFDGEDYPLVVDYVDGEFVAINNRTLYCYKEARYFVDVVVKLGELKNHPGKSVCDFTIKVRGAS